MNRTLSASEKKQQLLDQRYLAMARVWAQNSYCNRRQVGALMVKNKMIISDGYNGTPSGFENECEDADAELVLTAYYGVDGSYEHISGVQRRHCGEHIRVVAVDGMEHRRTYERVEAS